MGIFDKQLRLTTTQLDLVQIKIGHPYIAANQLHKGQYVTLAAIYGMIYRMMQKIIRK